MGYTNYKKTSKTPRKPFDRERLLGELRLIGTYGLKNKREVWRVQLTLAKLRKAARELMTLDADDPRRIFEGDALIRRIVKLGLLSNEQKKLDYVLGLTTNQFLERRLQTFVSQKQLANFPSFMVSKQSESHIKLAPTSVFSTGKPGR